ncbi:MAG: hypothetical protein Q7T55_26115 [Solirubrobacteraceae bacterium]|nr:hypothetical protein [Solirubrobacteraceae bacterium]
MHRTSFGTAFACTSYRDGVDLLSLMHALGHSRLDVTQAYLISIGATDLTSPVIDRKPPMVPLTF